MVELHSTHSIGGLVLAYSPQNWDIQWAFSSAACDHPTNLLIHMWSWYETNRSYSWALPTFGPYLRSAGSVISSGFFTCFCVLSLSAFPLTFSQDIRLNFEAIHTDLRSISRAFASFLSCLFSRPVFEEMPLDENIGARVSAGQTDGGIKKHPSGQRVNEAKILSSRPKTSTDPPPVAGQIRVAEKKPSRVGPKTASASTNHRNNTATPSSKSTGASHDSANIRSASETKSKEVKSVGAEALTKSDIAWSTLPTQSSVLENFSYIMKRHKKDAGVPISDDLESSLVSINLRSVAPDHPLVLNRSHSCLPIPGAQYPGA